MDLSAYRHVHCVGAGGIGISGVMKFLFAKGVSVSGSDAKQSMITDGLVDLGIPVSIGHDAANIPSNTNLIVYTEAATIENVERAAASERGIQQMGHFDFLGELSRDYRTICVTGTNGKSTTTAMTGKVFIDAGLDPTVFVGSIVPGWKYGNVAVGASDILIIEGDEYRRKMLKLHPETTLITNVELDHTDIYKDLADVEAAFHRLGEQTSKTVFQNWFEQDRHIYCGDGTAKLRFFGMELGAPGFFQLGPLKKRTRTFANGTQSLTLTARTGKIFGREKILSELVIQIPGEFNMMNALGAMEIGLSYGISLDVILTSLRSFSGVWRRFERVGYYRLPPTASKIPVISDYGHHPTAVRGTLEGAREFFPTNRIVLLFEPHQHNRTKELFHEFAQSFGGADVLILSEIYGVLGRTENADVAVTSKTLLDAAMRSSTPPKEGHYAVSLDDAEAQLRSIVKDGDVVIVMGAGDVDVVARNLVA